MKCGDLKATGVENRSLQIWDVWSPVLLVCCQLSCFMKLFYEQIKCDDDENIGEEWGNVPVSFRPSIIIIIHEFHGVTSLKQNFTAAEGRRLRT